MINDQLKRILSTNHQQLDTHLLINEQKLGTLQQFLSAKSKQLGALQKCFLQQIEQIKSYEKTKQAMRNFIKKLREGLEELNQHLLVLAQEHRGLLIWKAELEERIAEIPNLVKGVVKREEVKRVEGLRMLEEGVREREGRYQEETDRLKKAIIYLEKELKKKNAEIKTLDEQVQQQPTLQPQPPQGITKTNSRSFRQLKNIIPEENYRYPQPQPHISISPKHQHPPQYNTPKSKQQPQLNNLSPTSYSQLTIGYRCDPNHKLRSSMLYGKQQQRKVSSRQADSRSRNKSITPSKHTQSISQNSFSRVADSHKKLDFSIPQLPQLVLTLSYTPPIYNGFDVLIQKGKEVYKGMWKRGVFEGRGKFYSENWVYDGEFKNGVIDGLGSLSFAGCTFIGKFVGGRACGEGTLYTKDRPISGVWKDNTLIRQL